MNRSPRTTVCSMIAAFLGSAALLPAAHADIIIDDGPSGIPTNPALTGTWLYRTEAEHGGTYNDTGLRFAVNTNGNDTATYTANIPAAGLWSVEIYMTNTLNASGVPVSVGHAGGTQNLTINQAVVGATDGWMSLGVYQLNAGSNTYAITSGSANTTTDAVRWAQAGTDAVTSFVVDTNNAGVNGFYSESGSGWITSTNRGVLYNTKDRLSNGADAVATVTSPLAAAFYEIGLTWGGADGRATNALVRITDAFGATHDMRINQELNPTDSTAFGTSWLDLGSFAFDTSSTVQLIMDESAGGSFIALDGVRFTYASAIPEPASLALMGLGSLLMLSRARRA